MSPPELMVHHTCALTHAHKHEGQVLQPETAAFRDLVRRGISNKERAGSVLQRGQEGRARKASVKVQCHSAASREPRRKGGSAGERIAMGHVLTKEKDTRGVCCERGGDEKLFRSAASS